MEIEIIQRKKFKMKLSILNDEIRKKKLKPKTRIEGYKKY